MKTHETMVVTKPSVIIRFLSLLWCVFPYEFTPKQSDVETTCIVFDWLILIVFFDMKHYKLNGVFCQSNFFFTVSINIDCFNMYEFNRININCFWKKKLILIFRHFFFAITILGFLSRIEWRNGVSLFLFSWVSTKISGKLILIFFLQPGLFENDTHNVGNSLIKNHFFQCFLTVL